MASLSLRNISKKFGSNEVVRDISMEIESGEFLVLAGPSGCGKSTMLRMIAGLEDCDDGDIYLDQKRINDVSPKDRDIAIVFQHYALYPHMTAYENIAFGLKVRGMDKKEIDERVKDAAQILEITELLERKPSKMSGGQRQRVAIGRAIVREPKLFLFDEPLSNLDASLRTQMRFEIATLHKKLKATMIYVTHDQVEAMTLASKIAILNKGKLQQAATPFEIYQKPANSFVAGFIGSPSMNFMDGQIIRDSDKNVFLSNKTGLRWHLPEYLQNLDVVDKKISVGIRPEDVHLKTIALETEGVCTLEAEVSHAEWLGYDGIAYALVEENPWKIRIHNRETFHLGSKIKWQFRSESCHYFDLTTGLRLK